MGSIYSTCTRVLVSLGPIYKLTSDLAAQCVSLDFIVLLPVEFARRHYNVVSSGSKKRADDMIRDMFDGKCKQKGLLSLCKEIIRSPWFSRAWVFQEVVLPRKSAFGLHDCMNHSSVSATVALPTLYELCKAVSRSQGRGLFRTPRYDVLKEMYGRWAERYRPSNTIPMTLV